MTGLTQSDAYCYVTPFVCFATCYQPQINKVCDRARWLNTGTFDTASLLARATLALISAVPYADFPSTITTTTTATTTNICFSLQYVSLRPRCTFHSSQSQTQATYFQIPM